MFAIHESKKGGSEGWQIEGWFHGLREGEKNTLL
jgi:hypothetical protein